MTSFPYDHETSGDGLEVKLTRMFDTSFVAQRLNDRSENGWAVVGQPSGSIAMDHGGKLLIKLSWEDARAIAKSRTETFGF